MLCSSAACLCLLTLKGGFSAVALRFGALRVEGKLRAECGTPWRKNLHLALLQPSCLKVMEELLVVGADVVKLAVADVPVFRELLGFCDLVCDSVDA